LLLAVAKVHQRSDGRIWRGDSPWVTVARAEYQSLGLDGWDNDRVNRLTSLLGCTVYDLCAICGEDNRRRVDTCIRRRRWPMVLVLHFWKLERARCRMRTPDIQDVLSAKAFDWG
jgi:hypothetical protein